MVVGTAAADEGRGGHEVARADRNGDIHEVCVEGAVLDPAAPGGAAGRAVAEDDVVDRRAGRHLEARDARGVRQGHVVRDGAVEEQTLFLVDARESVDVRAMTVDETVAERAAGVVDAIDAIREDVAVLDAAGGHVESGPLDIDEIGREVAEDAAARDRSARHEDADALLLVAVDVLSEDIAVLQRATGHVDADTAGVAVIRKGEVVVDGTTEDRPARQIGAPAVNGRRAGRGRAVAVPRDAAVADFAGGDMEGRAGDTVREARQRHARDGRAGMGEVEAAPGTGRAVQDRRVGARADQQDRQLRREGLCDRIRAGGDGDRSGEVDGLPDRVVRRVQRMGRRRGARVRVHVAAVPADEDRQRVDREGV